ncbi:MULTISPECIES: sialate:H+ symport family MFS transporter [Kitasatospora]|uniref:Putative major facilitator superfamily transporter n=1 Tax=Kitasatospora setae (strain ATCC 33774 / DSM 43861 / JCM 3304 / KCC A-0304 / NBRC 14216 / KM-6054) TaxID=452652 RepID=E4N6M8_KITSK|nr:MULTISPECIES: sialate:H+ symport family MFS transporter [Kitasatospora]BAJ26859.1 putative major facilitator superfamily transporter [Kitasatospora setae KM-6054]
MNRPPRRADRPPTSRWYRQVGQRGWKAFGAAWAGYVLDGFDFVLITLVLTEVKAEFGLDAVRAASLVSAAFVSRWLGGMLLGALGDRYGRRAAMTASILLFSLGTLGCGLAGGYAGLYAARLVVGLGMAGEYGASATYVMESWPERMRGRASGFLISGYSIGTVLAAQVYSQVVPALGWRWMFYLGVLPALFALWMRRALPEAAEWEDWEEATAAGAAARPNPFRPLFARPGDGTFSPARAALHLALAATAFGTLLALFTGRAGDAAWPLALLAAGALGTLAVRLGGPGHRVLYLALTVTVFAGFLYTWPIQALLPTYLKTELHHSAEQVRDVLFWAGFGTAAGCVLAGFTGDRFGPARAYACTLAASLLFVFPVFAVHDDLLLLGVLLFLLQATSFGISGLLPRYLGGHLPVERRASGLGFVYNVGALGGAVAPLLGARLAEGRPLGQSLALLTFGLSLVVITLIGLDVPGRLHRLADRPTTPGPQPAATPGPELAAEPGPERPAALGQGRA